MRIALLLTFLLGGLFSCGPERYTWNQRMTVTVETPGGVVSGSSVMEVRAVYCADGCGLAGDVEVSYGYTGEAVAVEVLPGEWLFALIGSPAELMYRAAPERFEDVFEDAPSWARDRGTWLAEIPNRTGPVELTGEWLPRFVTITEMGNPDSARVINPLELEHHFGPGVQLLSVELEVTDNPATVGRLEEILQWWWSIGVGDESEMPSLRVFDDSPRGWSGLGVDDFWSLDLARDLFERYE